MRSFCIVGKSSRRSFCEAISRARCATSMPTISVKALSFRSSRRRRPSPQPRSSTRLAPLLRSEEHTSELQSQSNLVCRLLLEKKKNAKIVESELVVRYVRDISQIGFLSLDIP